MGWIARTSTTTVAGSRSPTGGSQLENLMQEKEAEMRAGGREEFPIKIIETAGKTLERTLVNSDPFDGNQCTDAKCEPRKNPRNKINCRRNGVTYRISCLLCLRAGRPSDVTRYLESACYYGESGKKHALPVQRACQQV